MEPFIRGLIQAVLLALAIAAGWSGIVFTVFRDGWSVGRCAIGFLLIAVAVWAIVTFRRLGGRRG